MPVDKPGLIKKLGPGLLYAGAAIGVSHVVQSTKAGGSFGWTLWWAIVLANLAKAPFFEFGARYPAATGRSLIDGYQRLGKWAIGLFVVLTLLTMFTIQAAVTFVTAGLAAKLFGLSLGEGLLNMQHWTAVLLLISMAILGFGHYSVLDKLGKVIIVTLSLTTLAAFTASMLNPTLPAPGFEPPVFDIANKAHLFFLIALMGWMPAPVDIAAWTSLWTLAKRRDMKMSLSLKDSLLDFHVGYWTTLVLALAFFGLGALTIYNSGETLSPSGAVYAGQLVSIYTKNLGDWSYWIIAIAAFTTMFSTTLTCLDAAPRVLRRTTQLLVPSSPQEEGHHGLYWGWISFLSAGTLVLVYGFVKNMAQLVDLATTLSFLTTPALAAMNYMVVTRDDLPEEARLSPAMKAWSFAGLVFLTGFALYYLWVKFF